MCSSLPPQSILHAWGWAIILTWILCSPKTLQWFPMVLRIQLEFLLCLEALQAGVFHVSLTSSPTLLFSQLRLSHTGLFPVIHTQPSTVPLASSSTCNAVLSQNSPHQGEPSLISLCKIETPIILHPLCHFIFFLSSTYLLSYLFSLCLLP